MLSALRNDIPDMNPVVCTGVIRCSRPEQNSAVNHEGPPPSFKILFYAPQRKILSFQVFCSSVHFSFHAVKTGTNVMIDTWAPLTIGWDGVWAGPGHSGSRWCHELEMAAVTVWMVRPNFCPMGGSGAVSSIFLIHSGVWSIMIINSKHHLGYF